VKARARLLRKALEGVKPKGASGSQRLNPASGCKGLSQGSKPRNRGLSGRPVVSPAGATDRQNGMWVLPGGNVWVPCGRGKLRRANPKSAAGAKQSRHGLGGSKPPRG